MLLSEIKKKASSFIQDKCKTARLALTDVTEAQVLAEEATSGEAWGPDSKTMTLISEAAEDMEDYRRIVDVLHKRFRTVDWKEWRQSYKTLALLEFLLTHGPEEMFDEFQCDAKAIRELGDFVYVDETGFDWGACMRSRSKRILTLLSDEEELRDAREKALRISREIQGFGNLLVSPSSSPSSSSSRTSRSSFGSSYSGESPTWSGIDEPGDGKQQQQEEELCHTNDAQHHNLHKRSPRSASAAAQAKHLWDPPVGEGSSLIDVKEEKEEKMEGWSPRLYSRLFGTTSPRAHQKEKKTMFRSLSDVNKKGKKKIERQSSLGY